MSLRNQYRADLCFLITYSSNVSGAAWPVSNPTPWTSYLGFAIGNYDYVRDNKTFSHETGHNFGALHNLEEPNTTYSGYKHGYLNESANFCTIMSYWTTSPSQRKNIWSDPYNTWSGYSRGVVDTSENVRWLNDQRADIVSYRTFQTSGTITSAHHWRRDITLTGNVTVTSTLTIESDCNVDLAGYSILSNGGTIILESGATINPDIRLQSGSTLVGLYPTINSAFSASTTGQAVHIRGTHTFSGDLTIPSGEILYTKSGVQMKFPSNKWLYVNGTLYGNGTTYTRTSGTWGGLVYQSGSSGSLSNCTISYANYGLYIYNASPTIESNVVNNSKIYLNNSNSYLENNYFNDAGGSYD